MKTSDQSPAKRGYKADRKDLHGNREKRYNVFNMERDKNYREEQPNLKLHINQFTNSTIFPAQLW